MSAVATPEAPKPFPKVVRPPDYKPQPLSADQRINANRIFNRAEKLGGEQLTPFKVDLDPLMQDRRIASEFTKVLKSAGAKDPSEERTQNVRAIVDKAKESGVDKYDLADTLSEMGEDPRAYIEDLPPEEPTAPAPVDAAAGAPPADAGEPPTTPEQMANPEKRARLQQEAYAIGRRIVNTEIVQHAEDNGAAGAYDVLNRLKPSDFAAGGKFENKPIVLSPSVKPTESSPTENLPQITVSLLGKEGPVGVKQILGISVGPDGQKVAKISYKRIADNGTISTGILENVAMQDILNGQVLAEEARLSSLLSGDVLVAFKAYTAALRGGEKADAAFADIPAMENALKGAAQAVGMLTSADIASYVANMQAQLPRDEQGAMSAEATAESRRLEALKTKTADVVLVGPDIMQEITMDGLNLDAAAVKTQLDAVKTNVAQAQQTVDQLIRSYHGPDKFLRIEEAQSALDTALKRQTELQVLASVGEVTQNGSLGNTLDGYFQKLTSGEVPIDDAQRAMADFRNGDYMNFLNRISPIPGQGENETAAQYTLRKQQEEDRRRKLLQLGKGAGILVLLLAALTSTIVNPQMH